MKKRMQVLAVGLSVLLLAGCGKNKESEDNSGATDVGAIVTTEDQKVSEGKKENDITCAEAIKGSVERALGYENIFIEFTTKHSGKLISLTEQGMSVLEAATKDEIIGTLGGIPEVNYPANGADHFAFIVDENGSVTVYVCNANNSSKWLLAPEIDVEYGGTVNTELLDADPTVIATAETDVELEEVMKGNDVTSAKTIKTAVATALGNEDMFIELTTKHAGEYIAVTEQGLSVLEEATREEIITNLGVLPEVNYIENGAEHFAFVVDENGGVTVYVCNADESQMWILAPELDVEYGGTVVPQEDITEEATSAETEEGASTETEKEAPTETVE